MKKIITALVAFFAATSMALAGDLPSKAAPVAPIAPAATSLTGWYVGANAGGLMGSNSFYKNTYTIGAIAGYQANKFVAVEGTFDYFGPRGNATSGQTVMANVVAGYPVNVYGYGLTPYALVGTGYGWNQWGLPGSGNAQPVWNVGAGLKAGITRNWEADLRYRYMNTWEDSRGSNNIVTLGVNYKF